MMERVVGRGELAIENREKRRSPRIAMRIPVIIYSGSVGNIGSLYFTENISRDGMFLSIKEDCFASDQRLYLEFSLPLQIVSRKIRLIGRVLRRQSGGAKMGYGIFFEKIFEKDYSFLSSYLSSLRTVI